MTRVQSVTSPIAGRVAVVVGGIFDETRRTAAQTGEKPRVDVLEMEQHSGSALFDFAWLETQLAQISPLRKLLLTLADMIGWSELLVLWAFRHIVRYDVVYATCEDVGVVLAVLLRLTLRRSPRVIVRLEQPVYGRTALRRAVYAALLRFALRRVDLILCRTHAHAELLQREYRVAREKLVFVPEPTDTQFFTQAHGAPETVTAALTDQPVVVSAGLEMRDYETLIEAVRGLPLQLIIGAGSPWSKFEFSSQNVPDLPTNVQVSSFTPQQMRELYRAAALVVVAVKPTNRACGMNVVLEAWAMERAVIASRTVGLSSYIEDQKTGRFVAPGDVEGLRDAITELLSDTGAAARLGKNGRARVEHEHTLEHYLERIEAAVRHVKDSEGPRKSDALPLKV